MEKRSKTFDLTLIAMMAAVITVCSWISIPTVVPFTLQTFAIFLTLMLIGGKRGTLSILVYITLGAIGVPVFANFKSGLATLTGPTGGYVIGFIFMGLIYLAASKLTKKWYFRIIVLVVGLLVCYAFGTVWFIKVMGANGKDYTLAKALGACVIPFLIPDGIKLAVATIIAKPLEKLHL